MYGKDIERILKTIGRLYMVTSDRIFSLASKSDYRIATIKHVHDVKVYGTNSGIGSGRTGDHYHLIDGSGGDHTHPTFTLGGPGFPSGSSATDRDRVSYPLTYTEDYSTDKNPDDPRTSQGVIYESEHTIQTDSIVQDIIRIFTTDLIPEIDRIRVIDRKLYTSKENVHNSIGSPYTELYDLNDKLKNLQRWCGDHTELQWIGEKHALLNMMQLVVQATINAKYAVIIYHDYLQRGYDYCHNDNKQSVSWDDFENGRSTGNVSQKEGPQAVRKTQNYLLQ